MKSFTKNLEYHWHVVFSITQMSTCSDIAVTSLQSARSPQPSNPSAGKVGYCFLVLLAEISKGSSISEWKRKLACCSLVLYVLISVTGVGMGVLL